MSDLVEKCANLRRRIAEIRSKLKKEKEMREPVYEKGYPSYEAVNRDTEPREGYWDYMLRRTREENEKLDQESKQEQTNRELDDLRSKLKPKK